LGGRTEDCSRKERGKEIEKQRPSFLVLERAMRGEQTEFLERKGVLPFRKYLL